MINITEDTQILWVGRRFQRNYRSSHHELATVGFFGRVNMVEELVKYVD
jgi:hypothetical protein